MAVGQVVHDLADSPSFGARRSVDLRRRKPHYSRAEIRRRLLNIGEVLRLLFFRVDSVEFSYGIAQVGPPTREGWGTRSSCALIDSNCKNLFC